MEYSSIDHKTIELAKNFAFQCSLFLTIKLLYVFILYFGTTIDSHNWTVSCLLVDHGSGDLMKDVEPLEA